MRACVRAEAWLNFGVGSHCPTVTRAASNRPPRTARTAATYIGTIMHHSAVYNSAGLWGTTGGCGGCGSGCHMQLVAGCINVINCYGTFCTPAHVQTHTHTRRICFHSARSRSHSPGRIAQYYVSALVLNGSSYLCQSETHASTMILMTFL